jgi:hypothetical protein
MSDEEGSPDRVEASFEKLRLWIIAFVALGVIIAIVAWQRVTLLERQIAELQRSGAATSNVLMKTRGSLEDYKKDVNLVQHYFNELQVEREIERREQDAQTVE